MVSHNSNSTMPTIVFGAFDRHNFGDLLFPHIASALLPNEKLMYAGLGERDLRAYGGHRVHALQRLARQLRDRPVRILHAGGELLACSAWEAAIMLLQDAEAKRTVMRLGEDASAQQKWAHEYLGMPDTAPYTTARALFSRLDALVYNAVGGADLALLDSGLRKEVIDKLEEADFVSVRDRLTLSILQASGITARLLPDPAVMVADLFSDTIAQHAQDGKTRRVRTAFPRGYLAVQCSADFDEAAVLESMATQLKRIAILHDCGIVFFCAGLAPWHDDAAVYHKLAALLQPAPVHIFDSLNIWDICALIANSRGCCGSSLHGRIVALAHARPRMTLRHPRQPPALPTKHAAFVQTWEDERMPGVLALEKIEEGMHTMLSIDGFALREKAAELVMLYRKGFDDVRQRLLHGA